MKRIFLFHVILFASQFIVSQNNWQYYTRIADSLQQQNDYNAALKLRLQAVEIAQRTEQDTLPFLKLLSALEKSEVELVAKQSDSVFEVLKNQTESLKEFNPTPERIYRIYNKLYEYSNSKKNITDSDYFITQSLKYQYKRNAIDSLLLLETLQKSGVTYKQIGKLNEAVNAYLKAIKLCEDLKIKKPSVLGLNYMSLSELYRYRFLDNPKLFLKYLKKAQTVYENANAVNDLIRVYLGLSDFMSSTGKFQQSINYLKKAFKVYKNDVEANKKIGLDKRDVEKEMKLHNYFIEKYRIVGNEQQMLFHLNEMLKEAKPQKLLNDNIKDLICLSHLYLVEYYEADYKEKALFYLNQGKKYFPSKDLYFIREEYDLHFANVFMANNELTKAKAIIKDLNLKKELPLFIAKSALEKRIILNVKSEKYEDAYTDINYLIRQYYRGNNDIDIRTVSYKNFVPGTVLSDTQRFLNLAQAFETTAKTVITEKLYWLALKQFQANLNEEILNERVNALYSDICYYFFSKASQGLLAESKLNKFLIFTESIESKHLLNTFINNRKTSKTTALDSLIKKEQRLRTNITHLKKQYLENKSDSINQLIFEYNIKLEKINNQLAQNTNKIAGLVNTNAVLENIKQHYVIKFKQVRGALFRLEVNKEKGIKVAKIKNYKNLKDRVVEMVTLLKNPSSKTNSIVNYSNKLFDELFTNTNILKTNGEVYIIPDDILYYLPFELLAYNGNYLLNNLNISYASAFSFINSTNVYIEANQVKDIALFAPSYSSFKPSNLQLAVRGEPYYLEGAINEVKSISKLFNSSDIYINEKATKTSFTNLPNKYSILHLSMHSFINDQDAELSSLVFNDGNEDYELYISELYGLNLNANMAVLSACNTGVGKLKTGQGIVSMNTAFTAAGVPAVLSSLWSAPDMATQQIMTAFYRHLKNGETKSIALKNAKLDYLNSTDDPNLKHPYYWAGFILTGDTSAIILNSTDNWWLYGVLFFVVITILFLIIKKRPKIS
ncbi:CHAT domain-containing protein [Seonamhaeicola algicola]|uniref:CHAT domain-containing protein n=2 Tax=Seonamhaeicola TaxID=1649495 RepID=A0A5C7AVR2_9FLAO|nr:CHAT domain-containing protein [Seonamhaeicola algicola]TXE12760.1 CHAT domain-containing protein [Seonamhaeicola algicola]